MSLIITLVATSVMLIFVELQSARAKQQDFIQQALARTRLMAEYSASPLIFEDRLGERDLLAKLIEDPQVLYIRLDNIRGETFAEMHAANVESAMVAPAMAGPYTLTGH